MSRTNRETLRALLKTTLARLENDQAILVPAHLRLKALDEMEKQFKTVIFTEQDLHESTVTKMGKFAEVLSENELTENEQFKTAKAMLRKEWGENELHGIFYRKSLKDIAREMTHWVMTNPQVEDVFESDDVLEKKIVEVFQRFNPKNLH
jgi:hypothetical protein